MYKYYNGGGIANNGSMVLFHRKKEGCDLLLIIGNFSKNTILK
jgi:hypothetical protein